MKKIALIAFMGVCLSACTFANEQEITARSNQISKEALAIHNQYRAEHHAAPLVWDDQLAQYAGDYAANCEFRHSHGPYGENLAMGYPTINVAVQAWYNEKNKYSYANPGFSMSTGHFTQVVWKSTRKLGCGYAVCDGNNGRKWKMWVCEYSPAGNVMNHGYFERNVG